jgi:peptide/nickel transport system permease protein
MASDVKETAFKQQAPQVEKLDVVTLERYKDESMLLVTWRRFRKHKMAMFGALLLVGMVIYVLGGSLAFTEEYANYNNVLVRNEAPSNEHPFGTDSIGRDILARTVYGGQISLVIGLSAALIQVTIGTLVGALAGYYGGLIDSVLMRITEALLNIPSIFLLLVMSKFFGNKVGDVTILGRTFSGSVVIIVVIIGATSWMYLARIVRSTYLQLREQDFVLAAECVGVRTPRIIFLHILPNAMGPIIVAATLGMASAILSEAYISFLGLGVRAPTATWGNMMEGATSAVIQGNWWQWVFPGLLILLTSMGINFVGDGLRDALDPHSQY